MYSAETPLCFSGVLRFLHFSCIHFALRSVVVLNLFLRQGQMFPYAEVSIETGLKFLQYRKQETARQLKHPAVRMLRK
jgi:hypothetical protein